MKLLICTFARADGSTYDASVSLNDSTAGNPGQVEKRREQFARAHAPQEMTGWKIVDPTKKANTIMSIGKEEPPVIDNPAGVQHPDATGNTQEQFTAPEPEPTPGEEAAELFGEAAEQGLDGDAGGDVGTVASEAVEGAAEGEADPFAELEDPKPRRKK